jgi:LPXTG-motif cell wall-anchored protein
MNKLIGLIGTTLGGGLIGAGIQRTYSFGNKMSSGFSKMFGGSSLKFDDTTWYFLIGGALVLLVGVFFTLKRK